MSAKDELRRLLEAEGISWFNYTGSPSEDMTCWNEPSEGHPFDLAGATESDGRLWFSGYVTPEQIIDIIASRNTCRIDGFLACDRLEHDCREFIMVCGQCGYEFGYINYTEDGDVWTNEPPRFCPNCGRRTFQPCAMSD